MALQDYTGGSSRDYKRGAVMGLTVAEAFILLSFILLLLFTWWQVEGERARNEFDAAFGAISTERRLQLARALEDGTFDLALEMGARDLPVEELLEAMSSGALALAANLKALGLTAEDALKALESENRDLASRVQSLGMSPQDVINLLENNDFSRFVREEDLQRLMQGAVRLPPGTQVTLAEAIEVTPETEFRAALEDLLTPQDVLSIDEEVEDGVNPVLARLTAAEAAERSLIASLEEELGDIIRSAGGSITPDGSLILPERVLFDRGSDVIRDRDFLRQICPQWTAAVRNSGVDIGELKIEGHASSEGRSGQSPEDAYLYNLNLSQRRAQNALRVCLDGMNDEETTDWARARLSSIGYSSNRPILNAEGHEDREASRRVMFSMAIDREQLLRDIRQDLEEPSEGEAGPNVTGSARVIDGDTLDIAGERWRIFGIDAPEVRQTCENGEGVTFQCGEVVRDRLIAMIGDQPINCNLVDIDRYDRSVGICHVGEQDLGQTLVRAGWAVAYLDYSDRYEADMIAAQQAEQGLWAGTFTLPSAFRSNR